MSNPHPGCDGLPLPGLDGANPLGFLAALGLLRIVAEAEPLADISLAWTPSHTTWTPTLYADTPWGTEQDALLDVLVNMLVTRFEDHPIAHAMNVNSRMQPERTAGFRDAFSSASLCDRVRVDWLTAIGCDAVDSSAINQIQAVRRDNFPRNLRSLMANTTAVHLRRSLFHLWDFADPLDNNSLHLNPAEDRRHAHQWNKPSGDPDRKRSGGMIGANRLAIEAWPLFATVPAVGVIRTVGFRGERAKNKRWSWPLWSARLTLRTIASLLANPTLQAETIEAIECERLRARGVGAVYRSRRILVGKTPNFTPAERIA